MNDLTELERAIHHCLRDERGELVRTHLQVALEGESFAADPYQTAFMEGQRHLARMILRAWARVEQGVDE